MIKKEIVGKEGKDLNLAKLCFEKKVAYYPRV